MGHWDIIGLFSFVYSENITSNTIGQIIYSKHENDELWVGNMYIHVYTLETDFRDAVLRRYVFQNPARFQVMTQLRPWNDPDRKDKKKIHRTNAAET